MLRLVRAGRGAERALSNGAVRALQKRLELGQRSLDAVPLDRHGTGDALIAGAQLFQLGEDGDVLLAEDLDGGAEACQGGGELRRRVAGGDQPLGQLHAPLLHLGEDLHGESEMIGFLLRIGGIDGVGDHRLGRGLGHQRFQGRPAP